MAQSDFRKTLGLLKAEGVVVVIKGMVCFVAVD